MLGFCATVLVLVAVALVLLGQSAVNFAPIRTGEARTQTSPGRLSCGSIIAPARFAPPGMANADFYTAALQNDSCLSTRYRRWVGIVAAILGAGLLLGGVLSIGSSRIPNWLGIGLGMIGFLAGASGVIFALVQSG